MKKDTLRSFSLDSNIHNTLPVVKLRKALGAEGFGVYIMLLCRLRTEEGCISVRDYDSIAFALNVDSELVRRVVEDFGLFELTDTGFYSREIHRQRKIDTPEETIPEVDTLITILAQDDNKMKYLAKTYHITEAQLLIRLKNAFRISYLENRWRATSTDQLYRLFNQWLSHKM